VYTDHTDHAKVPHEESESDIVHGYVVRLQHLTEVHVGEEKEKHEGGDDEPAVDELVTPVLVEEDEEDCHDNDRR